MYYKMFQLRAVQSVQQQQIVIQNIGGFKDDCKGAKSTRIPFNSEMGTNRQWFGLELVQCGLAPILNMF